MRIAAVLLMGLVFSSQASALGRYALPVQDRDVIQIDMIKNNPYQDAIRIQSIAGELIGINESCPENVICVTNENIATLEFTPLCESKLLPLVKQVIIGEDGQNHLMIHAQEAVTESGQLGVCDEAPTRLQIVVPFGLTTENTTVHFLGTKAD